MKAVMLAVTIAVGYVILSALTVMPSRVEILILLAIVFAPAIIAGGDQNTRPFLWGFVAASIGVLLIETCIFLFPVGHMRDRLPDVIPSPGVTFAIAAVLACMFGAVGGVGAYVIRTLRARA